MDKDEEVFDLVDENDTVVGQARRGDVHRLGLLHRAVYAWVFDTNGRLLLQKRSPKKKIGPNQWDLSVAEHLQPGEDYRAGIARGLEEELGIVIDAKRLRGPLAPTHKRQLHQDNDFHDVELVQSFVLEDYDGDVELKDGEAVDFRWVLVEELIEEISDSPDSFTMWMREEGSSLNWNFRLSIMG